MTDTNIIAFLSDMSDELSKNEVDLNPDFTTEISAWKPNNAILPTMLQQVPSPVKIRIRTVENRKMLTRHSSSNFQLGTFSSSNTSSTSSLDYEDIRVRPNNECYKSRVVSFAMDQQGEEMWEKVNGKEIRVYKRRVNRKKRKPVIRLPKVIQGENEEE
jgi:hypothetical protein